MMNYKVIVSAFLILFLTACVTTTKDGKVISNEKRTSPQNELSMALNELRGEYAGINFAETEKIMQSISNGDMDVIKQVMNDPDKYVPPILFAYAEQVYKAGHYEVAMFWYYTAQLRARSDANKSLDKTVQKGVTLLGQRYGTEIGPYALSHLDQLELVMNQVLTWDETANRKYNPKWVVLLGEEAKISGNVRFVDESKYKEIDKEVRRGWKLGFETALRKLKEEQLNKSSKN